MTSDHEEATNPQKKAKSPEVLKQLRRSAKANLTRLFHKIEAKVKSLSSRDVITILRENLTEQVDQTLSYHTKYVESAGLNDEQRNEADQWAAKVDDSAMAVFKLIDEYLESITPEGNQPSTQDGSQDGSQNTTKDNQMNNSHAEAKRKRIAAEEALREAEREDEEYARQAAEKKRKLEADVHKRRIEETLLDKTINEGRLPPSAPNFTSTPVPKYPPANNNAGTSGPQASSSQGPCQHGSDVPPTWLPGLLLNQRASFELPVFNGDPRTWRSFARSFKELVHDVSPSNAQRIALLKQMLSSDVRYGLDQMLRNPDHYDRVWQELEEKYGDRYTIARAHLRSLQRIRNCRDGDHGALRDLAARLHDVVCGLQDESCMQMCSGPSLEVVTDKLPMVLRDKWETHTFRKRANMLTLVDLDAWLQQRMIGQNWLRSTYESRDTRSSRRNDSSRDSPRVLATGTEERSSSNRATTEQSTYRSEVKCQVCSAAGHPLHECGVFISSSPTERVKIVMQEGNCFRCLGRQHLSTDCKKNVNCSVNGCNRKHHPLLHGGVMPSTTSDRSQSSRRLPPKLTGANNEQCHTTQSKGRRKQLVLLPIVEVTVRYNNKSHPVLALLDSGSQVSLIHKDVADNLKMRGKKEKMHLTTFHGSDPDIDAMRIRFDLFSGGAFFASVTDALVVPHLNIANCPIDWKKEKTNWSHLADLDLPEIHSRPVLALIGMDIPEAHMILESRTPPTTRRGPFAQKTALGWTVIGCLPRLQPTRNLSCHTQGLDQLLRDFFEVDAFVKPSAATRILSNDERHAMNILESTTRNVNGRYEVGLLWRDNDFTIPNNRPIALQRLFSNERRFKNDPDYARKYSKIINEYIELGFARKLEANELEGPRGRTHHLVHFGVENPNKPGKLRVVFHASLKYKGTALNDLLSSGPDMLTNLTGVLIRFRTNSIGVSGDIEKMFHQVGVPADDQTMLRFVWREPNANHAPQTYQMCRQIFGAASSSTCCTWALRQAARDQPEYNLYHKVTNNFYVDNYLDSFDEISDAILQCQRMTDMLRNKGFRLNQWCSSSREVLDSIPASEWMNPDMDENDRLPIERTLGMFWDCELDSFTFLFKEPGIVSTKREMFSSAATIFDPLGCIAPVILPVKIIMQDIWREGVRWDQELPASFMKSWKKWYSNLKDLASLQIPRCLRPTKFVKRDCRIQLHLFADASKDGYGAVGYFRYETADTNETHVSFALAKFRVAPVRKQTIPKLELNGAWTAVEIARVVKKEFELNIDSVTFWTDSTTVLHWINSPRARHPEFVANRITHILTNSEATQWRHVPGALNPADDGSRGLKAAQLQSSHRWFNGPAFLLDPSDQWPSQTTWQQKDGTPNEAKIVHGVYTTSPAESTRETAIDSAIEQANTFEELKKRASELIYDEEKTPVENLKSGLIECVRSAQKRYYSDDIRRLSSGLQVHKTSRIISLDPYLDENGLLRVGGRLEHANLKAETRFPLIIPHDHPLAKLIILHAHETVRHCGKIRTLAEIRGRYWITKGLATVGKHIRNCITCRMARAKATPPRMAPLPAHRLQSHIRPFTNVGIDYFGPFNTVVGRRQEKRYGALFTCLSTRAVHLELAHYLTSDSFILAFRRFVGRRGAPSVVYSDNGTNLCAGEKEMRVALEKINTDVKAEAEQREIEWRFSPPSAPHFGGVWERLVKCCKSSLTHVLNGRTVSDEVLYTAFVEIESLMNGRPLTHISVDPKDPFPLTPNHFLLGGPHPNLPIAIISPKERLTSKSWRRAQQITNDFWRRWMTEYIPNLTERIKWTRNERALHLNDLVLVADKTNERGTWPVGRVTKLMPGKDGVVRTAVVKTKSGEYTRPVIKLFVFREADEVEDGLPSTST